ncbi:hypothetical protein HNR46_001707 [Haloferula luteola]|uniref:Peptidase n=1 Tax=Haloferula luteola TaxID=595692 RepID=A0A840VC20_9BACT|nr:PPC domain-containing protein [Haloferula luteola]MBB5351470.1 hypothetical protein [Haloferula luteola]
MKSLLLLTAPALAFSPDLQQVQPRGGPRGAEVEIHLLGERLQDPQEILFHHPGIEVLELKGQEDGKQAIAKVRIAADASLGEHPLRLRTSGGVSYLRTLWVGALPEIPEIEPNNSFDQPQSVPLNTTIQGVSQSEDEDWFSVHLEKDQTLSVEIEAMRLGRTFFDAYLAILDPNRFELASCDDASLLRTDAFVSVIAPETGDYRILVREAAYEGNDNCQYRLHVGTFPRPSAVFPPGARPGETLEFDFGDGLRIPFTIPENAIGHYPLFASRGDQIAPSPNWIFVSPLATATEIEPNNLFKEATPLPPLPCAAHGRLDKPKDQDIYRFSATKDQNLDIRIRGRELRCPIDGVLSLRDAQSKQLASNDDQGSPDPFLQWTCPADGEYLIVVSDKLSRGGPDFTYRLEIDHRSPAISATLPVFERDNSQARKMIVIPRGNRYATTVNLTRSNLGCDALFEAGSLPDGVTLQIPPIPRTINSFPVIFEASADAPIAGGWHPFSIRSTGENIPPASGPLHETVHHIEINNQGPYHTTESDLIAVAVTQEAPLTLDLDPPAVPVVPRGILRLHARLGRQDGFNSPVTLRMLWNPPGIGSPATLRLEEGQTEIDYEINANPDAPPGDWQIAVLAEADTPQGSVVVSSSLVPLKVGEPWVTATIDLAATEQGRKVPVVCQLEHPREFTGIARAELLGLPHGTQTTPLEFDANTTELTFPVEVAADAAMGKHAGLFLRIDVPDNGTTVLHQTGHGGTLRIDAPAPAVAEASPPPPAETPAAPPTEKPLSRLEQLRAQAQP